MWRALQSFPVSIQKPVTAESREFQERSTELIESGRFLHSRGWVPATSGNFSARLSDNSIAITVSGEHKGYLTESDIMRVDLDGNSLDGKLPSAETLLHTALYKRFPNVNAVLHPHTANSVLASRVFQNEVILKDHELVKIFPGIKTHESTLTLPIFPNDQDIARLAGHVLRYLNTSERDADACPGFIISGHGFYSWGDSVQNALNHLEALEFLLDIEVRLRGLTKQ